MFDIGMTELLVIGVVALIVVGPKDLPGMFRTLGRFTGKMKAMARDFQRAMDEAADESGVKDVRSDLRNMTSKKGLGLDKLDTAADRFEKWDPGASKNVKGPATAKMSEERAEKAQKIREESARRAAERRAAEAETASAPAEAAAPKKGPVEPAAKPSSPEDGRA